MCLTPAGYDELLALQEMQEPPICYVCLREALLARLRKRCDLCGEMYTDKQVESQLESL